MLTYLSFLLHPSAALPTGIRSEESVLFNPLCTLACCPTLTSLSISSTAYALQQFDVMLLGRLRGLQELTLRFPGPADETQRLSIFPLSRLTNLQRLVVQGVHPEPSEEAAAAAAAAVGPQGGLGGEAAAAAGGGDGGGGSSSNLHPILPKGLTSLVLEGHWDDDEDFAQLLLRDWASIFQPDNQLRELHILNYPDLEGRLLESMELGALSELTELRISLTANSEFDDCYSMALPASVTLLSKLQVLEVGTYDWQAATMQHCCRLRLPGDVRLLGELRELKVLGWVSLHAPKYGPRAGLCKLTKLCCCVSDRPLPDWMTASSCPLLQELQLDGVSFSDVDIQSVARLTQLTSLRLDAAIHHMEGYAVSWANMEVLGRRVPALHRLELINYTSEELLPIDLEPQRDLQPLLMPNLSALTQIKQLQLVCELDPGKDVPEQPSSSEFLQGLSKLTQLEQLQLEGYSTVTPVMVSILAQSLPQLQLLEMGLCKHPELVRAAAVEDGAEVSWEMLHSGFVEVQRLCSIVRPKLQVKVGYARQWLK